MNQQQIPAYALYGEFLEQVTPDVLHFETIRDRSRKHNWSIKPHRHRMLAQLFVFSTPDVVVQVGDRRITSVAPMALFVPPMLAHGFQFKPSVVGGIISVPIQEFKIAGDAIGADAEHFDSSIEIPETHECFDATRMTFGEIEREFRAIRQLRNEALATQLRALLIHFHRASTGLQPAARSGVTSRQEEQIRQFCSLVETHFRSDMRLDEYAALIGISKVQLTRTCDKILGTPPNHVVVNRRLMEAKRKLAYSQSSIGEVSHELGFKDVAYFSRFFKKLTGKTPSNYRSGVQHTG